MTVSLCVTLAVKEWGQSSCTYCNRCRIALQQHWGLSDHTLVRNVHSAVYRCFHVLTLVSVSRERVSLFEICWTNRDHYRKLGMTLRKMLWVKYQDITKVRVRWGQLNHRLYIRLLFCVIVSLVQLDCANAVRDKGLIHEQWERAAENWGGGKKPVLISCGLVFPAGISTEREGLQLWLGEISQTEKKKILSLLILYTALLSPSPVPIYSTFSSRILHLFPMFRAASKFQSSLSYYLARSLSD